MKFTKFTSHYILYLKRLGAARNT